MRLYRNTLKIAPYKKKPAQFYTAGKEIITKIFLKI